MVDIEIRNIEVEPDSVEIAHVINKSPYVGENGNWYVFDSVTKGFVDTGIAAKGEEGEEGVSPVAKVTKSDGVTTITITDKSGTTTANILDGKTPVKGVDYFTESDIEAITDPLTEAIGTKANQSEVDQLTQTVNTKAAQTEVDNLSGDLNNVKKDLSDKADKSELDGKVGFTDWASSTKTGVIGCLNGLQASGSNGYAYCETFNAPTYANKPVQTFISKGTLENVLAERLKEPQFELIEEITLTEDVKTVTRNAEPNGTPYAFLRMHITLEVNNSPLNSAFYIKANDVEVAYGGGASLNGTKLGYASIDYNGGFITGVAYASTNQYSYFSPYTYLRTHMTKQVLPNIQKVDILSTANIPSGTVIKIYGIRA